MKTQSIEFTAGELADLTSALDHALQAFEEDDVETKESKARYKVLLQLYRKLLTPTMQAYLS